MPIIGISGDGMASFIMSIVMFICMLHSPGGEASTVPAGGLVSPVMRPCYAARFGPRRAACDVLANWAMRLPK